MSKQKAQPTDDGAVAVLDPPRDAAEEAAATMSAWQDGLDRDEKSQAAEWALLVWRTATPTAVDMHELGLDHFADSWATVLARLGLPTTPPLSDAEIRDLAGRGLSWALNTGSTPQAFSNLVAEGRLAMWRCAAERYISTFAQEGLRAWSAACHERDEMIVRHRAEKAAADRAIGAAEGRRNRTEVALCTARAREIAQRHPDLFSTGDGFPRLRGIEPPQ